MRTAILRGTLLGLVIAALVLGSVLYVGYRSLHEPFAGWPGEFIDVELEPGLHAGTMLERLVASDVLPDSRWPRVWLRLKGGSEQLHAGEYRFSEAATPLEVLDRLRQGDILLHAVTLPEGLHLDEIAQRLEQAGFGTAEQFREIIADPTPIRKLDPLAEDLEGYLFPDTYRFPRGVRPERVIGRLVARFGEVVGDDYAERAGAAGLELREAVILASMIEAETSVPGERPRISRVFHNRIARRMRMQCDPTVMYALHRAGRPVRRLSLRDLEFDSPWNTYRIRGLPRGPIGNPGRASLEAAVNPSEGEELYFVAAPDGGHRFSATLAAHRRAVADWRAYSRSSR